MANVYENVPVLSKVKIGSAVYYLKDADVRKLLDTYGNVVTYNVATEIGDAAEGLATAKQVAAAIDTALESVAGALIFAGVVDALPETVAGYEKGDVILVGTKEYVCDGSKWIELGDEGIYLTIANAEANYVKKTFTIAGIDMQDAIAVEELQNALALKALAYKDTASVTVNDYATGIAGAAYKPEGQVSVTLSQTSTAMTSEGTFKPAGSVSGNVTAAGTVSITRDDANGAQVSGTVSAPTITVTPATATVQHIDSVGSLPSLTGQNYVAPSVAETKGQFASEGLVADIDADDEEMLVFSAAAKTDALTGTGFNAGSVDFGTFNAGALPTLGDEQTVVTGIASAEASAPVFTGDKFGATFAGSQVDINATFAGTEGNVSVSGNYDKAGVESTGFTGTDATITPTLEKGQKTITVQ